MFTHLTSLSVSVHGQLQTVLPYLLDNMHFITCKRVTAKKRMRTECVFSIIAIFSPLTESAWHSVPRDSTLMIATIAGSLECRQMS